MISQAISLPSGREIGEGKPVFIIAEIGSNWRTLDDCLTSIRGAKACGADAVKFQLFDYNSLFGYGRDAAFHISAARIMWNSSPPPLINPDFAEVLWEMPPDWLPRLKAEADKANIEFMCSAFSPEFVDAVDPFVNIHKVASAEATHVRMLERLREIGKPVILSTGAKGYADIAGAVGMLTHFEPNDVWGKPVSAVLLYCVASYPAREVDLGVISLLGKEFSLPVGYSDHTTDVRHIPTLAMEMGACIIEKHVNFTERTDTPDAPHSISGADFKLMVDCLRGRPPLSRIGYVASESSMIMRHNRRLIATRDISEGEILSDFGTESVPPNFGIYRSLKDEAHAFSPFVIDEVNGCIAKRAIKAGDGIGPGDV